jgi:hypothetical protein
LAAHDCVGSYTHEDEDERHHQPIKGMADQLYVDYLIHYCEPVAAWKPCAANIITPLMTKIITAMVIILVNFQVRIVSLKARPDLLR